MVRGGAVKGRAIAKGASVALAVALALTIGGCTEPNPYLSGFESWTSTGAGSGASSTPTGPSTPPADSGSTTDSDLGSSSGGASCAGAGMECIDRAPEGWAGPFAWMERSVRSELVECAPPWDQALTEAFSDLFAPSARCGCECGPVGGSSCGSASVTYYQGAGCGGQVLEVVDLGESCNELDSSWSPNFSYSFEAPVSEGGGCVPVTSVRMADASFLNRHQACGGALSSLDCGADRWCAPLPLEPFEPRWCVWQEGDAECPEGIYAQRERLFRSIEDQRGCEACSCAPPRPVPCAGGSAVLSPAANCSLFGQSLTPDDCSDGLGGPPISAIDYDAGVPAGQCDAAAIVPTGEAAGTEPVTFCCTR